MDAILNFAHEIKIVVGRFQTPNQKLAHAQLLRNSLIPTCLKSSVYERKAREMGTVQTSRAEREIILQ